MWRNTQNNYGKKTVLGCRHDYVYALLKHLLILYHNYIKNKNN